MLCSNKLTGEHNAKKYFKKFSFCGSTSFKQHEAPICAQVYNLLFT